MASISVLILSKSFPSSSIQAHVNVQARDHDRPPMSGDGTWAVDFHASKEIESLRCKCFWTGGNPFRRIPPPPPSTRNTQKDESLGTLRHEARILLANMCGSWIVTIKRQAVFYLCKIFSLFQSSPKLGRAVIAQKVVSLGASWLINFYTISSIYVRTFELGAMNR